MPINPLLGALGTAAAGGLAAYFGGKSAEKSAKQQQQTGLSALQLTTPVQTTTRDPKTGGFTSEFRPGTSPAILSQGDPQRALEANRLTRDFKPTFNSLQEAIQFGQSDRNFERSQFGDVVNKFISSQNRQFGGIGNTGASASTIDAIGDAYSKLQLGAGTQGLNLLNTQNQADQANLAAAIANSRAQAPTLTGPGGAASQLVAQTPQPAPIGVGEIATASAGSALQQLLETQQRNESQQKLEALVDRILKPQINAPLPDLLAGLNFTLPSYP